MPAGTETVFVDCPSCGGVFPAEFPSGTSSVETECMDCAHRFSAKRASDAQAAPATRARVPRWAWGVVGGVAVASVFVLLRGSRTRVVRVAPASVAEPPPVAAPPPIAVPPPATTPSVGTAPLTAIVPPRPAPVPVAIPRLPTVAAHPAPPPRRFTTAPAAAPPRPTPIAPDPPERAVFRPLESSFTSRVDRGEPADRPASFPPRSRVGYHIRMRNTGDRRTITVDWRIDGELFITQHLDVGTSWRWRTWAFGRAAGAVGNVIEVRVSDEHGNVLRTDRTTIGAAGVAAP